MTKPQIYIEKQFDIGTIYVPKEYFKGKISMKCGPYGWPGWSDAPSTNLVYFGGITNSDTILGLGGSLHHIIGEEQEQPYVRSHSATYAIISTLSRELNINNLDYKNKSKISDYELEL